ncbi:embryoproteinsis-associated protein EMB8, partial [Tanacetum coccineum]
MAENRVGAEIVYGAEECYRHSVELLDELGFPRGVLPLKDLVECGRVRET